MIVAAAHHHPDKGGELCKKKALAWLLPLLL